MELSAFAHFTRRNVKVVQPGLVYVIEWASGWESIAGEDAAVTSAQSVAAGPTSSSPVSDSDTSPTSASTSSSVITRRRSLRAVTGKEMDKQRRREQAEKGKKVKTGKHGYYVYEEVTSDDDEQDAAKSVADSRTRTSEPASSVSSTQASSVPPESSGDTIYVACVSSFPALPCVLKLIIPFQTIGTMIGNTFPLSVTCRVPIRGCRWCASVRQRL